MNRQTAAVTAAGVCVAIAAAATFLAAAGGAADGAASGEMRLLAVDADGVALRLEPPAGARGTAEIEVLAVDGKSLAHGAAAHAGKPVEMKLAAAVKPGDPAGYYVRWRATAEAPWRQKSLLLLGEMLETIVLGHRDMLAGTQPMLRVIVRDRNRSAPVVAAKVAVALADGQQKLAELAGTTDARGELNAALKLPDRAVANSRLTVRVTSRTAADKVEETVQIRQSVKTLLTTDKPLYQPGQTIHIRALSLRRPDMKPLAGAEAIFEVEDARGNKVFKKAVKADAFGISHADFDLADELNMGDFKVRAVVAGPKEEKTVAVKRYVLPKFKIALDTGRQFFAPGERVIGELQADYFFGKPLAGAKVKVRCFKFDVAYSEFQTIDAATDAKGHCRFEVDLPKHFVGQPLEAGKASARLDIDITDTADHIEKITRNVTVTANPILVAAVPESGALVAGLPNRVYLATTLADGSPISCAVTWTNAPHGEPVVARTDEGGFGELTLTPATNAAVTMQLEARGKAGDRGTATVRLDPAGQTGDDRVMVRTDKTVWRVGEAAQVSVMATRKSGTAYVDVIKDRQTYLTKTLELRDGKAAATLGLNAGLSGTVEISAYLIGRNGVIVRDRRLLLVDPANDLKIAVRSDEPTYLPGKPAKMSFKVTNSAGAPVAAALGVMVVDEAVFALQEMQPGLEKVYFYLEKEIARPRYEIHGWDLNAVMPLPPGPGPAPVPLAGQAARKEQAARFLLASATGSGQHTIAVNTLARDNKLGALPNRLMPLLVPRVTKLFEAAVKFSEAHRKDKTRHVKQGPDVAALVKEGLLKKQDALDPWGGELKLSGGSWNEYSQLYWGVDVASAGIDGVWGSEDDVTLPWHVWVSHAVRDFKEGVKTTGAGGGGGGGPGPMMRLAQKMGAFPAMPAGVPMVARQMAQGGFLGVGGGDGRPGMAGKGGGHGGAGAEPPRIRRYFPETLYFNPAVITDSRGLADLNIPMADSITTWRLTCMGSSAAGELGSTTAPIRVFQEFFVDIDFPVALTQNDEVHVPVVVYNYLKTDQDVRLKVKAEDWFELKGDAEVTVKLGPSQVKAVQFPLIARKVGHQTFTVFGYGSKRSDAIARSVEVAPDGAEHVVSFSGRLKGNVAHSIDIPAGAIDGASRLFVKIYPGTLSQVVEGLDKMLRMPGGCFEQTSSSTYPNVLVMDYMKTTGKITPEIRMKAESFINSGYQRLVSFECPGGGFSWFGNAPAHRILTAYGLMEFSDMSKVHEVDEKVISRTQAWLAACQEKDGSYKPSAGGIQEGAINKFTDDVLRNTAYITWALASSGFDGPHVGKGLEYLRKNLDNIKDNYTLALTANTFAAVEPKGRTTAAICQTLVDKATVEGERAFWKAAGETPTHGSGDVAAIEITGLALQALVKAERHLDVASKAVGYLAAGKDSYGTWQSTQATIQALRGMLMAEGGATVKADATIDVLAGGKTFRTVRVTPANSDVLQLVDLKELAKAGANDVALTLAGEGSLMYQIVARYWLPRDKGETPAEVEPLAIDLKYDRTKLETNDILTAEVTVTNNRAGAAKMVIVDLGLPPGFTLMSEKLDKLVADKAIEKYSTTGRQIIVYLSEVAAGKPVKLGYQLLAKYPLRAKTPVSAVYEYYNPKVRSEAKPVALAVGQRQ